MQAPNNNNNNPKSREEALAFLNQQLASAQALQPSSSSTLSDLYTSQQNLQSAATSFLQGPLHLPTSLQARNELRYPTSATALAQLPTSRLPIAQQGTQQSNPTQPQPNRNRPESFTLPQSLAALQRPVSSATQAMLEAAILRENALLREQLLLGGRRLSASANNLGNAQSSSTTFSGGSGLPLYRSFLPGNSSMQRDLTDRSLEPQIMAKSSVGRDSNSNCNNYALRELAGRLAGFNAASLSTPREQSISTSGQDGISFPASLPCILAVNEDTHKLSAQQVLLRHQIEVFNASKDDLTTHKRGRNKPIKLGQVGIRCRHCAHLPVARRQKGSTYFPASLHGLYQASQNMSTTHFISGSCSEMPEELKKRFAEASTQKVTSSVAGRPYWRQKATALGLIDIPEDGIRFIRDLTPSQIAQLKQQRSSF